VCVCAGRGTTDCLGHVALLTDMFLQLAETKPALSVAVFGCFIASEENSTVCVRLALFVDVPLDVQGGEGT
jgi:hypothetical protein